MSSKLTLNIKNGLTGNSPIAILIDGYEFYTDNSKLGDACANALSDGDMTSEEYHEIIRLYKGIENRVLDIAWPIFHPDGIGSYIMLTTTEILEDAIGENHPALQERYILPCRRFLSPWAESKQPRTDPLVIDLDNDGIETIGFDESYAYFDDDGDGIANLTTWVSWDDGLLVLDKNQNGSIDDGSELFGDQTVLSDGTKASDGFEALTQYDDNQDGVIDANDAIYDQLLVWQDAYEDGVSSDDELFTLSELGITSISVVSDNVTVDLGNDNTLTGSATVTYQDSSTTTMGDVTFTNDTFYRVFTEEVTVSEAVQELPNITGSGIVRDLWEAATISTSLYNLLSQHNDATATEQKKSN